MKWMTEKGKKDLERASKFYDFWWGNVDGPAGPVLFIGTVIAIAIAFVAMGT